MHVPYATKAVQDDFEVKGDVLIIFALVIQTTTY